MFSNNNVTEGLLIAVLCAIFVLLLYIAWHVATSRLYLRQPRRLAKAIGKMDCDELTDWMLSCSGVSAGDSLASPVTPDAVTEQQSYEVTRQKAPDRVQKYLERLTLVAAGGQANDMGYFLTEKH